MNRTRIADFLGRDGVSFVVVLGSDEIASAIALRLTEAGRRVVLVRDPARMVLRRGMAFDDAAHGEAATLEGVEAIRADDGFELAVILSEPRRVAVVDLDLNEVLAIRAADVLIDARPQGGRERADLRGLAGVAIGVGPGFVAGGHCDVAVESRGEAAGRAVWRGPVAGEGDGGGDAAGGPEMRSPCAGRWRTPFEVGRMVYRGMTVGRVDGEAVVAPRDGRVIGIARDDALVIGGVGLVEIVPPGGDVAWRGVDARGRAIAEGIRRVLAAIATVDRLSAAIRNDESLF
ncbi:xanthine dehydrogenase [Pinisolibacter aquiterrae]|uniref:xanthine dehydrogenase n=1 Tax=Pinisolibacter aquiterrae TaxID=2815579 RepID=UPI001C3C56B1|nr:xanthine dehydrogenase [Pinisolibacter aquiterrae]MBV5264526.1 xanthine dehydrogenase [Pinisolibacter aquiterrae]MCC8235698.1 xanthine dehydrogenase [Pinisolibacter aquiterrae]